MRAFRWLSIRPKSRPSWLRPRDSTNILLAGRRQRPDLEGIQRLEEDSASNGSLRCEVARGGSFGRTSHLLDSERQGHRDYGQHRGGEERETESLDHRRGGGGQVCSDRGWVDRPHDGQQDGQAQGEADALRGADEPRSETFLPRLGPGERRDAERRKADARAQRPDQNPGEHPEIAPADGNARQEAEAYRDQGSRSDQDATDAETVDDPRRAPPSGEEENQRGREKRQAGVERRVAEDLLHVDRQDESGADHRSRQQERKDVRVQDAPPPEESEGQQRGLRTRFDDEEGGKDDKRDHEGHQRRDRKEAV